MIKCEIKFKQNPQSVVYSGSVVNGEVLITLGKPVNVRGISLIFKGIAHVEWSENERTGTGDNSSNTSRTYRSDEKYIHTVIYLIGSSKGNAITIDAGVHIYNFSCLLPPQIPSSVESNNGHIRYTTKIVFERPWKFDKTFTVGLTVLKHTDLNQENPFIRLPATLQVQKKFLCWPFSSKPLIVEFTTPQTGYVPGQSIPVIVNFNNESGKKIDRIKFTLKKIIKCTSRFPSTKTKIEIINVANFIVNSVTNKSKESIYVNLLIPAVPPSTPETICRIIQVYYELRIKTIIKGLHIGPIATIPIFIGTIPLNNFRTEPSNSIRSAKTINGLPLPTYEEAVYLNKVDVNKNDKHSISQHYYLPRYPVYHFKR